MDISTLKAGDEVYVFSRGRDCYIKRTVDIDAAGYVYFLSEPHGHHSVRDKVYLDNGSDAVTSQMLPAAEMRHAERRKSEKTASDALDALYDDALGVAGELHALGVSTARGCKDEPPSVSDLGLIRADLTVEQARALLDALKGRE